MGFLSDELGLTSVALDPHFLTNLQMSWQVFRLDFFFIIRTLNCDSLAEAAEIIRMLLEILHIEFHFAEIAFYPDLLVQVEAHRTEVNEWLTCDFAHRTLRLIFFLLELVVAIETDNFFARVAAFG